MGLVTWAIAWMYSTSRFGAIAHTDNVAVPGLQLLNHCITLLPKRANVSGQRLPGSLHPTQAASVNPLHPNCYVSEA
ncbi:hypothetical protein [Leptothermofonsia sp. ETS-13]|uniref:hypothetical protein n=1 Tax=Leptothermofonsia sp. ETS-13 TaxID=3035696 RepID=UPI003BA3D345